MAKYETINGGPGRDRTYEGEAKGFTVLPIWPLWNRPVEPPIRLELMTAGLQNRCSTNWAKVAREADCIKNDCLVKIFLYNIIYDSYNSHFWWRKTLLWSGFWVYKTTWEKYRNPHPKAYKTYWNIIYKTRRDKKTLRKITENKMKHISLWWTMRRRRYYTTLWNTQNSQKYR